MRSCLYRKRVSKSFAFFLGATSIASQILLLREYLATLYGNEMVCALALSAWLFWAAVGGWAATRVRGDIRRIKNVTAGLAISSSVILPLTLVLIRMLKNILGVHSGEMMGLGAMAGVTFVTLAPLALIFGALFVLICKWVEAEYLVNAEGQTYLWKAKGATIAGGVVTLALLPFFSNLQVAVIFALVNLTVGLFALFPRQTGQVAAGVLFLGSLFFVRHGLMEWMERVSQQAAGPQFTVVDQTDSHYGRLTLLRLGEKFSLYENGLLNFSTRDVFPSEERVHLAMLAHPAPQRVLLIGGGLGGGLEQVLKYKDAHIDYVELDPKIVDLSENNLPEEYLRSLRDTRVNLLFTDGRLFIKTTAVKYDVVIIALPDPTTAFINRYYTREFFTEARRVLQDNGIFTLGVFSSKNDLSEEARSFLRSVHTTLASVFPDVQALPGDTDIFLARKTAGTVKIQQQELALRLKARQVSTQFVNEYYLSSKLSADRVEDIQKILAVGGTINSDNRPTVYFYGSTRFACSPRIPAANHPLRIDSARKCEIFSRRVESAGGYRRRNTTPTRRGGESSDAVLWAAHVPGGRGNFLSRISWLSSRHLFVFPLVLLVAGLIGWRRRSRRPSRALLSVSIMTTGFSSIVFQIVVILAFQTFYGYAYYQIGLIFCTFMLGLVLGSLGAMRILRRAPEKIFNIYRVVQLGITLYPLLIPLVFVIFRDMLASKISLTLFSWALTCLPIGAGFLGGMQYLLATRLLGGENGERTKAEGTLYAWDALGAAVGALMAGAILIPLVGVNAVAFLCAGVNGVVLVLLINSDRHYLSR